MPSPFKRSILSEPNPQTCKNCQNFNIKFRSLANTYEELIYAKEQELAMSHDVIKSLQIELRDAVSIKGKYEEKYIRTNQQIKQLRNIVEQQKLSIDYFRNRQVELISRIQFLENNIYLNKDNSQTLTLDNTSQKCSLKDLKSMEKQRQILKQINLQEVQQILDCKQKQAYKLHSDHYKQNNLITQLNEQNQILNLKHRIALLRAVEFNIL